MLTETGNQSETEVLPLANAVFCLDCETISNSRREDCPVCKSRSVVNLAKMLGGSLLTHSVAKSRPGDCVLFDATITVGLPQMQAKDLESTVEKLSMAIGSRLARNGASLHIKVEPSGRVVAISSVEA